MNRIDTVFAELRAADRVGFVGYLTVGDPSADATPGLVRALVNAGTDVIELGIPFSDPLADGATIQAAASRALAAGMTVSGVLEVVRRIRRDCEVPLVLFTYLNPIFSYGMDRFYADAAEAGVDGVLILDLPPDETGLGISRPGGLKQIRLIAPTTPAERMATICDSAEGFVYYVSREGVTGEQAELSNTIAAQVAEVRKHTPLPVAVGFGISTAEQSFEVARHADAVVVGSAIVRRIAQFGSDPDLAERIGEFVRPLADAAHTGRKRA